MSDMALRALFKRKRDKNLSPRANAPPRDDEPPNPNKQSKYARPTIRHRKRSLGINDSAWNRKKILKLLAPVYDHMASSDVHKVGESLVIKYGCSVRLYEAAVLRYLAKYTSIPVPKVYCAFEHNDTTYILMDFIDGHPIGINWESRSEAGKEVLMKQLKGIFEDLRSLPNPLPGVISGVEAQTLYDPRIWKGHLEFGPFADESDFHKFLRSGLDTDSDILNPECWAWITDEERAEFHRLLYLQWSKKHQICFTHGDVSSTNILVKNGGVVALIDFETSGWYPEYWEYTTAMGSTIEDEAWKSSIPRFLKPYPAELEMETLRRKHYSHTGFRGYMAPS